MNEREKARFNRLKLVYQVITIKLIENAHSPRLDKIKGGYPEISMARTRRILSVIYHIPKELHYNVIKEMEEMKILKVNFGTISIKFKAPKKEN